MYKDKFIITFVLVLSVFIVDHSVYQKSDVEARIWANGEKEFFRPIDVVWSGKVISTMASGSCLGLEGEFNGHQLAMACLPDATSTELWKFEGTVTVTGKWLGITCAYKNTIFGECVPEMIIKSIRQ